MSKVEDTCGVIVDIQGPIVDGCSQETWVLSDQPSFSYGLRFYFREISLFVNFYCWHYKMMFDFHNLFCGPLE